MVFKSLTTRVIILTISLLAFGISIYTYLNLKREQTQLINAARESTELLLNTIERSIYSSMRIGNTEDTRAILEMVGQNTKLAGVRIFHPHGTILKSSIPGEVGGLLNPADYQLFLQGKNEGVFTQDGRGEVLVMQKPIYNDEPCHICHGNKSRIIGILDVNYSLQETRRRMWEATRLFILSTVAIVCFLAITISLVMFKFVKKPLTRLTEKMALVEQGDLSVRMQPFGKDEVGRLMASFDSMVERLDNAKRELEQLHFQQMERADRLASVGEMAAGIAHEIKNPLTGIAAAITIIKDDFTPTDPRTEIVNEVLEQVKRLDKTVNDLLFFGKPTPPEPTYADLNALLKKTLMFASQHRGVKSIEKRLELQEDLPPVYVDGKQIQQVLLNLILNAVQAMPAGGLLTITSQLAEQDGKRWVRVSIADTGQGIPPLILGKIFTPFFTTKAQGTGLGLAICHKLVTQHQGTIAVTSEDGRGTVFTVSLPADQLPGDPDHDRPTDPIPVEKEHL
ncbi:ATP-binding protein [Geomobilimonas luticola]|uniref:histidine kinase n=1 Tax=Geomobilimonas luticola TaxID=1114878 RepID=A0ABS5SA78_9BACT|nr:ATP-binding protein [Geomobilimonas luticola]MBT0652285.1 HAMP domain-containing protein [Geomobilimonas luticola]